MSSTPRILLRLWLVFPVCACGFLVWTNHGRLQRVEQVSALAGRASPADDLDPRSPTGYANGQRELIVPERHEESFHWIAQTQQMLARGEWRVRRVDYDNAPTGREVNAPSPYRWWLGLAAWCDHAVTGRPIGLSVERAALWSDPLLHLLVVVAATAFAAWQFGGFSAALLAIGLVTMFPFAAGFLPGAPDDRGLANALALGSVLVLLAGLKAHRAAVAAGNAPALAAARRWFLAAGVLGGLGAWISVPVQLPILAGLGAGALLAAWLERSGMPNGAPAFSMAPPWRTWAVGGGTSIFAAYLVEYFPDHLGGWRLGSVPAICWRGPWRGCSGPGWWRAGATGRWPRSPSSRSRCCRWSCGGPAAWRSWPAKRTGRS